MSAVPRKMVKQGLCQIALQGGMVAQVVVQLAEAIGVGKVLRGKQVRARIGDHDALSIGRHEAGQPLQELSAARVAEEVIGHVGPFFQATDFINKFRNVLPRPFLLRLHLTTHGQQAAPHIQSAGEALGIEQRRDHEAAVLVR